MHAWKVLLRVIVVLALGAPAFAQDGRRLLDGPESEAFGAVGRLNIAGKRFCTATLIAPDLALTAAHCLYHPRSKRMVPMTELRFVAGLRFGGNRGWRRVVASAVPDHYVYDGDARLATMQADVALLRLEAPLDTAAIPTGADVTGAALSIVSYARDRAHAPSIETGCGVRAASGPVRALDCTVRHGASGAPVIHGEGGARRVVAVVSAIARGDSGGALTVDVAPLIGMLRKRLADGGEGTGPRG